MQADLDAKRAAGEVESTDMHVWDFQVTMNCVRHKAPAQGTMQEMVQLLLSPNLTRRRLEEKAQLALSSFFGWPAATRLVQALEVDSPCTESRYGLPTDGGAGGPSGLTDPPPYRTAVRVTDRRRCQGASGSATAVTFSAGPVKGQARLRAQTCRSGTSR